ncbi:2843_t:CDS:2 [Racocetra persica]|uniref:2843_t:CDS:1 n=1 Tax=Racocetra persica TaxID=160502 RepID=A0ACA9KHM5_9GLOM|nr:2843_t:CDS:2 [Racocetra persica]
MKINIISTLYSTTHILVECLRDFQSNLGCVARVVVLSGLNICVLNIETVKALTPFIRDHRAIFRQSLKR